MRILIAEDDAVSRKLLHATLTKWGFETVVCTDGAEALDGLQKPDAPEIAILDWMMPQIDGAEVCRQVRETNCDHARYIILLTAKSQREDLIKGLGAGADDYVTKPFDPRELRARLNVGLRIVNLQKQLSEKVDALEIAMSRLAEAQQSHKLEAIGRLSSGIAHEINTPMQYIGDNIRFLQETWNSLAPATQLLIELPELVYSGGDLKSAVRRIEDLVTGGDLAYALREVPIAVSQSLDGVNRVTAIVHAMRDFSHPSGVEKSLVDLNRAIEATITVARNEWKYVAVVETNLDPALPPVPCLPAEIQQVILNLLINASHAIADVVSDSDQRGKIIVSTAVKNGQVEIQVSDTGSGIPKELKDKIFDPFFTTKDVGKGTGQGLTLARSVIVQQHNGEITFQSEVGRGTTFFILLPLDTGKASAAKEVPARDRDYEPEGPACRR